MEKLEGPTLKLQNYPTLPPLPPPPFQPNTAENSMEMFLANVFMKNAFDVEDEERGGQGWVRAYA